jgi:hypothetical protein
MEVLTARFLRALLVCVILLLIVACGKGSSGTSASAGQGFASRYVEGNAVLVQCGLLRGTIEPPLNQPWYHDGKVLPFFGRGSDDHDAEFSSWWDANNTLTVGGMTLSGWREWAANNDKLPPSVCGPSASASAIAREVFPGQPDPWHS